MDNLMEGPLSGFDIVVLAVIALSALMSLGRGLVREATSVVSFIVGGLAAYYCLVLFEKPVSGMVPAGWPDITPKVILVVVGFIAAYWAAAFIGAKVSRLINISPEFGTLDRIAGAAFGAIRGALAAVVFVLLMQQILPDESAPTFVTKSQSYKYLDVAASWIRDNFPGFVERARTAIEAPVAGRPR